MREKYPPIIMDGSGGDDDVSTHRPHLSCICFLAAFAERTVFRRPEQALLCNSYHILICLQLYISRAPSSIRSFRLHKLCLFALHFCWHYYSRDATRRRIYMAKHDLVCPGGAARISSLFSFSLCTPESHRCVQCTPKARPKR